VEIEVPPGTLVVDAAKKAGNDIPVFCYHPRWNRSVCAACGWSRLGALWSIVRPVRWSRSLDGSPKIQFAPKLETSCTLPVSEGM